MDIVTIDFETYYAPDYTLSKMTTEAYIRDDRFEVIGVSAKVNDNPGDWYTGSDPGRFLNSLDYSDKAILCHHTAFDGAILSWLFGIRPKFWFDTLSMARPEYAVTVGGSLKNLAIKFGVGEKGREVIDAYGKRRKDFTAAQINAYGGYCINDGQLTWDIFKLISKGFPVSELMVIDQTIRMYTEPVIELDRYKLSQHLESEKARKLALLNKLGGGDPAVAKKVLMSNKKFASLIEAMGESPPMKLSPTTDKLTFAFAKTDPGMLALLDSPNPAVAAVAEVRMGVKSTIEETRTQRLIDVSMRGPLPIMLKYYGAHTGRFSGGDKLNLQNLPVRRGNVIRQAICAPDGYKLVACDSSQIEARVLAWLAGQDDLTQAFRTGRDVYCEFASLIFRRTITKADKTERFVGKTCIAEGTLVLTERGEVPIEDITLVDRVWDGLEWVSHDGVIYQGEKDVITYQGLTATPDHGVFTASGAVPLGVAASRLEGLVIAGNGRQAIRVSGDYFQQDTAPEAEHLRVCAMYAVRQQKMDTQGQSVAGDKQGVPALLADKIPPLSSIGEAIRRYSLTLQQYCKSSLQALWGAWDWLQVLFSHGLYSVGIQASTTQGLCWGGSGSEGQQWALRAREFAASYAYAANTQQAQYGQDTMAGGGNTASGVCVPVQLHMDVQASSKGQTNGRGDNCKARVYDILNAGPRRRFTAGGVLVLNCILGLGYGMGPEKFKQTLKVQASIDMDIQEATRIVYLYRNLYTKISNKGIWKAADGVLNNMTTGVSGVLANLLPYDASGITLPNGMVMRYHALRSTPDGYSYINDNRAFRKFTARVVMGASADDIPWTRIYGGKAIENIVQALARIIIADQMVAISREFSVILQVHDENIVCVPDAQVDAAKQVMEREMVRPPGWGLDIPIACDDGAVAAQTYAECK